MAGAPPLSVVIYFLSNCNGILYTSEKKKSSEWRFLKHVLLFFSFASLSFYHPTPIPALSPLTSLCSLPGLPCHSPISLRPLFCISCRLQLCTSFLCSLLVRYRYRFSHSDCLSNTGPLSSPFHVVVCLACWL